MVFMQPQDAIVFLFAFSVRVPRTDVCTVRCRCGKVPGSDRERQNSISLIGMEWHQTMAKYIIKRVAMGIFSIFIVATVTFFVMNLVPGGPFVAEKSISAAAQQALAEKYGLDKPLGVQYVNYMKSLLHGDLGLSLRQRGRTGNEIIASKLPVSCRLAGVAVLVALCIGIPLGCISAYNRGKWLDNTIIVFATCGIAIPSFISSVLLLYEFGMNLKLLPTVGLNSAAAYIMPVTALAIYPSAYITRLMRSSLLDVMGQDYMRTARAKGVSQFMILLLGTTTLRGAHPTTAPRLRVCHHQP